jgi:hypothetical protein
MVFIAVSSRWTGLSRSKSRLQKFKRLNDAKEERADGIVNHRQHRGRVSGRSDSDPVLASPLICRLSPLRGENFAADASIARRQPVRGSPQQPGTMQPSVAARMWRA